MTNETHDATEQDHEAGCLMCAVRALTEGNPAVTWNPTQTGATIGGVVLRQGETQDTIAGPVPFVDLWTGGTGRVRVLAYSSTLRRALADGAPQVGDRLQVWFDGQGTIDRPGHPLHGRPYKRFSANVQRGH